VLSLLLLLAPFVSGLTLQSEDVGTVVIREFANPAHYMFTITSPGEDTLEIYSLVGMSFSPRGSFDVAGGTTRIPVSAYTTTDIRKREGLFSFQYFVKSAQAGSISDTLSLRVVPLADALLLAPATIHYLDSSVVLTLQNTQNARLENVSMQFDSPFFTVSRMLSLIPYGQVNVTIPLDAKRVSGLDAGAYQVRAEVTSGSAQSSIVGTLDYVQQQGTSTTESSSGLLIRTHTTTKANVGNVKLADSILVRKNALTRLFTLTSPPPARVDRQGFEVLYSWEHSLAPGESWSVTSTTNYTFPFFFVVFIVLITFLVRVYSSTAVVLQKKVSYVKTKGGQFALKVTLVVRAKKEAHAVQVIDRLPTLAKLYDNFGIKPHRIDTLTRRLFWDVPHLAAGEERVFSYIMYSDVNVVGRFELPSATAVFDAEGKTHEAVSNRAFFVNETAVHE
jgi:hypothetical protein